MFLSTTTRCELVLQYSALKVTIVQQYTVTHCSSLLLLFQCNECSDMPETFLQPVNKLKYSTFKNLATLHLDEGDYETALDYYIGVSFTH